LELEPRGLPAATYTLNAILKSDGSTVLLSTFTVGNQDQEEIEIGHDGAPLPSTVDPLDVASINVTAVNGDILFTADLTTLTNVSTLNVSVNKQATPGAGVPNATGNLIINGFLSRGRVKGFMQFTGQGLPPNAPVAIAVNGVSVKTLRTGKSGNLNVKLSPKGKTATIIPGVTLAGVATVAWSTGTGMSWQE
jgi:hypothetical protein